MFRWNRKTFATRFFSNHAIKLKWNYLATMSHTGPLRKKALHFSPPPLLPSDFFASNRPLQWKEELKKDGSYHHHTRPFSHQYGPATQRPTSTKKQLRPVFRFVRHCDKHTGQWLGLLLALGIAYAALQENAPVLAEENTHLFTAARKQILLNCFQKFQSGSPSAAMAELMALARDMNAQGYPDLQKAILHLESYRLGPALALFDKIFIDDFKVPGLYFIVKGIIAANVQEHDIALAFFAKADVLELFTYSRASLYLHQSIVLGELGREPETAIYRQKAIELDEDIRIDLPTDHGAIFQFLNKYYFRLVNQKFFAFLPLANVVTVRVWLPQEWGELGHASLNTNEHHASFWPNAKEKWVVDELSLSRGRVFQDTLLEDVGLEHNRLPDYVITLDYLNVNAINEAIVNMREDKTKTWSLFGSSIFYDDGNCAGLTRDLLYKGGIKELANKEDVTSERGMNWGIATSALLALVMSPVSAVAAGVLVKNVAEKTVVPRDIAYMATIAQSLEFTMSANYAAQTIDAYHATLLGQLLPGQKPVQLTALERYLNYQAQVFYLKNSTLVLKGINFFEGRNCSVEGIETYWKVVEKGAEIPREEALVERNLAIVKGKFNELMLNIQKSAQLDIEAVRNDKEVLFALLDEFSREHMLSLEKVKQTLIELTRLDISHLNKDDREMMQKVIDITSTNIKTKILDENFRRQQEKIDADVLELKEACDEMYNALLSVAQKNPTKKLRFS